jgi:hypothetical protein
MADITKRLHYFDHQFLRANDFNDEQSYHVNRLRIHNRALHTPGVAEGLKVIFETGATAVTVQKGTAVDGEGHLIVLTEDRRVELGDQPADAPVYVTIAFHETQTDISKESDVHDNTRWTEDPDVRDVTKTPDNPSMQLILALVERSGTIVSKIVEKGRSAAGAASGDVTTRMLTLLREGIDSKKWPRLSCTDVNQAALENGSLRIDDGREILFGDRGQIRSLDNNHRIVFNRPANRLEFYEFGDISFNTGNPQTEKLKILANGNVGIGALGADKLEVGGTLRILTGTNPIRFTSGWSDFPAGAINQAEISNDTGTYKTLMIIGNRSNEAGVRRVSVWDRLEVNGNLLATGSVQVNVGLNVGGPINSSSGGFKFPDGTMQSTAAGSSLIPAGNIAAGSFGSKVGGGNYVFPGTLYWGSGESRTETKDDAGVKASKSGFFETAAPANYYTGASSWQHLIEARHSNAANNYALQIAGSFFDQKLYVRKTNDNAATAWSQFLLINSAGNAGIGTADPDRPLTIQGAGGTYMNIKASNGTQEILVGADGSGGIVSTMTNHNLELRAGGNSTKMTIKADGNVVMVGGLTVAGAITPSVGNAADKGIYFPVNPGGGAGDEAFIRYSAAAGETMTLRIGIGNDGDDTLNFWQSGADRLTIYDGKVGIGTPIPEQILHAHGPSEVLSTGTGAGYKFRDRASKVNTDDWVWYSSDNIARFWRATKGDLIGVLPNGNVGIGTLKPEAKLDVNGAIRAGNSDIYFTDVNHNHSGIGNAAGFAAIENGKDYNTLMILGRSTGAAGRQIGMWDHVTISGNLKVGGAKSGYVADEFVNNMGESLEQGDVVVISKNQVSLFQGKDNNIPVPEVDLTATAYDTRVCGVVCEFTGQVKSAESENVTKGKATKQSKASAKQEQSGDVQPGAFMSEMVETENHRQIAHGQSGFMVTLGAFSHCKVDADIAPIEVGDLLTTSSTRGHAQKVTDPAKAVGAIVGKALGSLKKGKGKIPVIVTL